VSLFEWLIVVGVWIYTVPWCLFGVFQLIDRHRRVKRQQLQELARQLGVSSNQMITPPTSGHDAPPSGAIRAALAQIEERARQQGMPEVGATPPEEPEGMTVVAAENLSPQKASRWRRRAAEASAAASDGPYMVEATGT
jgi:hypothetical protein